MSKKKHDEWSPERFVTEALERIEVLRKHYAACESAEHHMRYRTGYARDIRCDWSGMREALMQAELDEWRGVMMFGLTLDDKKRDRIKAAAHERFLKDGVSVSHWFNNGVTPGQYLSADEDKFREMCRKAFAPKEEKS